jgi:hypothetical protein
MPLDVRKGSAFPISQFIFLRLRLGIPGGIASKCE